MKLILNNSSGESVFLNVNQDETFLDLKKRVQVEVGIALDLQDLTIKGKTIKDSQRVWDYFANREKIDDDVKEPVQDVQCSVPGCLNTKLSCADKAFFNFPLEEIRCHQWALYCQRLNPDPAKQRLALNLNSVICADHFSKDQFVKNTTTLLKRTAVPCVKPANAPDLPECHRPRILQRKASTPTPLPITHDYGSLHESKADHAEPSSTMLCRLCANPSTDVMFIYDEIGNKLCLSEKINTCLPVTVRNTDPLPKQMCRSCFDKLSLCHELGEMCVKSEIKLRAMMEEKLFRSSEVVEDHAAEDIKPSIQNIDYSEPNVISKTELINDNCLNKRSYCCPLCTCGKMIAKSGIYRSNEFSPTNCASNSIKYDESDSALETFSVDTENELNEAYNNAGKESWSSQDYGLKISELDMDAFYGSDGLVGMELDSVDEEPWEDDDDIKPVIKQEPSSFNCRLCGLHFASLISLLEHSHIHCDSECYPCSFCDRYYPSKADLEAHFEEHKSLRKRILDQSQFFQCETCGMGFKNSVKFHSHSCRSNSQTASIRCLECNKSFRSNARLQFHMRFHEGAKPGYCDICHKTFPDEVKLYKHTLYLHSQSKGHCCEECGKVFRSVSSLRYHQRSHQGEQIMKPFVCDQCGKCFIRKSMLQSHVISTHKNFSAPMKCYTCKICFEAFPHTDYAVAHMQVQHPSESSSEASYSFEVHEVTMLYICDYCERCYTNASRACEHRQHHSSDMLYQCKLCSMSFVNYSMLEDHKVIHPEQDFATQFVVPIVYICEYCERYFLNYVKLSEHTTVHFGDHPYQCRYCDMKFASYTQLATHKETHDLQSATPLVHFDSYRPYECHYCRKAFAIEDALVKHIRMHTGEKPFVCDQCGKGFSQSSGLYTHQKVHSNERPYSCPVCPRKFKIKGDRDVHVRKHSGDRPYKCDYCQKAFMTQHVYSQHRKIHTGERPYKCDVCGIAFRRSHVLTVHKRIHTGEKPNICDICGKRYRQKGDMLKHRRLQHGIVTVKLQRIEF